MSEGLKNGTSGEITAREVRGEGSPDQRQTQPGSESRSGRNGEELWAVPERVSREAGPWPALALYAIGGILGQLINDLEYQLAYQQSSIAWYRAEIEKNQEALEWHEDKLTDVEKRLETLKAQAKSIQESMEE